jgi:hypothetical protein
MNSVSWFDRSTVSSSRPAAPTTSRADAVKDGRRSKGASHAAADRPRLDGGEHGVMLAAIARSDRPQSINLMVATIPGSLSEHDGEPSAYK